MAYFKGQGGRPKGAKNKKTDLFYKCEKVGLDVFERMLELALQERDQEGEWGKLRTLAEYLYAKPKDDGEREITPEMIREWMKEQNADSSGNEGTAG